MPGETIWVIDDEGTLMGLYEQRFMEAGFYFYGFDEADTPLGRLRDGNNAPDAVICEFGMKRGRNGFEFFRDAAEYLPHTVKYMITAMPPKATQVRDLDGVEYIQKPMDLSILVKQIEEDIAEMHKVDD